MSTCVILPVKSLKGGKSRLAPVLSPLQRAALVGRLLQVQLKVLAHWPDLSVMVVSRDPGVAELAGRAGAEHLAETAGLNLNQALQEAAGLARARGHGRLLVLPADLPQLTPADLQRILDLPEGIVGLAPDRHHLGTNALLTPAQPFGYQFGPGSFYRHRREAQRQRLAVRLLYAPGLQFDLDSPADWAYLQRTQPGWPALLARRPAGA